METFLLDILQDIHTIHSGTGSTEIEWEYPLTDKLQSAFVFKDAQSLLEFSYRVAVHNHEANDGHINPISLDAPGFDVVIPVNTTIFLEQINVLWFFYSRSLDIIVLVFTATYNKMLILVDANYLQKVPSTINNYVDGMAIHGGFWNLYRDIQKELMVLLDTYVGANTQIITTGMSLGGATSTIAALDLCGKTLDNGHTISNLIHYSFGAPKCFNTTGASHYDSLPIPSYRIANGSDIACIVPLPIMPVTQDFTHASKLIYFDTNLSSYHSNHVPAYLDEYHITPILRLT
jgi:hypothetical protein